MEDGLIYKALSGFYYVEAAGETIACTARGRFRHDQIAPLVGDRVQFERTGAGQGIVTEILPRRNVFTRPPLANLDQMVIIASAAIPVTDPYLIDRMTVIAEASNCDSVICLNKADLDRADSLFEIYATTGYKVLRTSAESGEGLDALREAISGRISAFTGNSGAGKSSILNALAYHLNIAVGDVSVKLGRGRHTTRHVELFRLPGGTVVADTPGFSAFDTEKMAQMDKSSLAALFIEFVPYLGRCRFTDCAHVKEPGCAVLDAVAAGIIHSSRHNSYVQLYDLASKQKPWESRSQ